MWSATCVTRGTRRGQNWWQWTNCWPRSKFSRIFRRAPKLRHSHSDDPESEQDEDVLAAEEELAHQNVRTVVLNEVALRYPVVFDVFNLCDMHGSGKLQQLSVAKLRSICEYFDIDVENIEGQRDAPSLSLRREFLESCDCGHHSACLWLAAIIIVTYRPGSTIYL